MAATTSEPCPVCGRALQQYGDKKGCPQCHLMVIASDVELRVDRLTDRSQLKLYADQARRLPWPPKGKQLIGFSEGKCFLTTDWPNLDPDRFEEVPFTLGNKGYVGLEDREAKGPRIKWLKRFTLGKTPSKGRRTYYGGIQARLPKICRIPAGKYLATVVTQEDYIYLVFQVEQASSP